MNSMTPKYRTHKVELCPQKTGVLIFNKGKLDTCFNHGFDLYDPAKNFQHVGVSGLFITSDDEIVAGDYGHNSRTNEIFLFNDTGDFEKINKHHRKIVASTDKSITPKALVPETFVQLFVDRFNVGNKIFEVEVEMYIKNFVVSMGPRGLDHHNQFDISTCNDGYITIQPQYMYSKRDVIKLLDGFGRHVSKEILGHELEMIGELAKWTKDKL